LVNHQISDQRCFRDRTPKRTDRRAIELLLKLMDGNAVWDGATQTIYEDEGHGTRNWRACMRKKKVEAKSVCKNRVNGRKRSLSTPIGSTFYVRITI
jgi:hypothetical protein